MHDRILSDVCLARRSGELACFRFTTVVKYGEPIRNEMKAKNLLASDINSASSTVRATISFPQDLYATLEEIAKQKKVSLAWVFRDAAEQYLADKWPLFRKQA